MHHQVKVARAQRLAAAVDQESYASESEGAANENQEKVAQPEQDVQEAVDVSVSLVENDPVPKTIMIDTTGKNDLIDADHLKVQKPIHEDSDEDES